MSILVLVVDRSHFYSRAMIITPGRTAIAVVLCCATVAGLLFAAASAAAPQTPSPSQSRIALSRTLPAMDGKEIRVCLLYTSDAADERSSVDLGGRRII